MIKVAFFDYDGTLVVHSLAYKESGRTELSDYIALWKGSRGNKSIAPNAMVEFCKMLKDKGIDLYALTCEKSSLALREKKAFLDTHYPGLFVDIISAATPEDKILIMSAYTHADVMSDSSVLFCDDRAETINKAMIKGFTCIVPQEVLCRSLEDMQKELRLD